MVILTIPCSLDLGSNYFFFVWIKFNKESWHTNGAWETRNLVWQFEWWHWDVSSAGGTERKIRLTEVQCFISKSGQCCKSVIFWCGSGSGSGSADPCLWLMDPDADPDPAIFVIDIQDPNKKLIFYKSFFLLIIGTCTSFSKIKSQIEVTKQ